jgi:hypothetical protein
MATPRPSATHSPTHNHSTTTTQNLVCVRLGSSQSVFVSNFALSSSKVVGKNDEWTSSDDYRLMTTLGRLGAEPRPSGSWLRFAVVPLASLDGVLQRAAHNCDTGLFLTCVVRDHRTEPSAFCRVGICPDSIIFIVRPGRQSFQARGGWVLAPENISSRSRCDVATTFLAQCSPSTPASW